MRQKSLTKETVIRRELSTDGTNAFEYELIMRESERVASYGIPLYSISVRMIDERGHATEGEIRDAFADAGKALILFEKIVRNLATPIDLAYIHEDEMR